ncbi:MAG TPA: class F sortase [Roseiflexaceae bacterium]|nr:class F sortase [Roseiflexaceae bacterium]
MRQHGWIIVLLAVVLSACGGSQQAEQPTGAPTPAAATNPPAPTAEAVPTASAAAGQTAAPTDEVFRAEPTAPLVLEPTGTPATSTASQPAPTQAARPTAQPAADEPGQPGEPTRIVIDAIGIDQKIVSVGLDKNRVPIVPNHDVGWYNLSAQPGQGDNIVLWGHVLRFRQTPKIPAPFARLKELKPGASVVLYDQAGKAHNYAIKQQIWVLPNEVDYILPKDKEMITMVSCIGDKVINNGEVVDESHRLITIAEPTS